jgi:hypothetical protein
VRKLVLVLLLVAFLVAVARPLLLLLPVSKRV